MAVATPLNIAAVLRRPLTADETPLVERRIQSAVGILEGLLHRALELDEFSETRRPEPVGNVPSSAGSGFSTLGYGAAQIRLARRPVASLTGVTTADGTHITTSCVLDGDVLLVPTLERVTVTYLAGDDPVAPQARDTIARAVAREFLQPTEAAAGVRMQYSVEGTSITYGEAAVADDPAFAPFTPDEARALRASLGLLVVR